MRPDCGCLWNGTVTTWASAELAESGNWLSDARRIRVISSMGTPVTLAQVATAWVAGADRRFAAVSLSRRRGKDGCRPGHGLANKEALKPAAAT